jgi:hypothetical protein
MVTCDGAGASHDQIGFRTSSPIQLAYEREAAELLCTPLNLRAPARSARGGTGLAALAGSGDLFFIAIAGCRGVDGRRC